MRRGVSPGACAEEAGSHVPRHGCTHAQQARPPHGTLQSRQVALLQPSSSRQAAAERAAQQVAGTRLIRILLFSLSFFGLVRERERERERVCGERERALAVFTADHSRLHISIVRGMSKIHFLGSLSVHKSPSYSRLSVWLLLYSMYVYLLIYYTTV